MGIGRLVLLPCRSSFLRLCPRRYIFETSLGFVGNFQSRAHVLGRPPCSVGCHLGCAVEQTRILSIPFTPRPSFSVRGVCVGLLQGPTPWTPNSHLSINEYQSILLLSVLRQSLEVRASRNLQGLPQHCSLPPKFSLAFLFGIDSGFVPWDSSSNILKASCIPTKRHWNVELNVD